MILPFPTGKDAAPAPALRRIATRRQRTLANPIVLRGVGFITGSAVRLRLLPAAADAGRSIVRTDLPGMPPIAARADLVTGTARRTTLGNGPVQITLVEHLLAALAGLRIDNCAIEIDGPEPPGFDGSAAGFADAILDAGIRTQSAPQSVWGVTRPVSLRAGDACLTLHPGNSRQLEIGYRLEYGPNSPIPPQSHDCAVTPQSFAAELAPCRTFVLESEGDSLRAQGIGLHLKPSELLVFGPRGQIVDNALRFANEPARHKILDLVGDLALAGVELAGRVVAHRSGHPLNVELARAVFQMHRAAQRAEAQRAA